MSRFFFWVYAIVGLLNLFCIPLDIQAGDYKTLALNAFVVVLVGLRVRERLAKS